MYTEKSRVSDLSEEKKNFDFSILLQKFIGK